MNESQISKLTPWLKPKYTMKLICVFGLVICLCLLSVFTILSKPAGAWLAITGEEGSAAAAFDLALFLIQEHHRVTPFVKNTCCMRIGAMLQDNQDHQLRTGPSQIRVALEYSQSPQKSRAA